VGGECDRGLFDAVGAFRFRQDMSDLFGLPATNVFLVKFSYWLNM
jgi:hypothetical protein